MNALFGRIASGVVAKLSLVLDLALLVAAIAAATALGKQSVAALLDLHLGSFITVALTVWLVTAMALRHYDPWASERGLFDDLAMTSILVLAVTTILAVCRVLLGIAAVPDVELFLLTLWPAALALRLALFRGLSEKEGPIDEVLVVGVGPLGRATAEDIGRKGRRHVLGHLRFEGEVVPKEYASRVLGRVDELDQLLKTMAVGEVYLASNSVANAVEMQAAIKLCERYGVPFAMPAYFFRLDRARPLQSHAVADGYLHYQSVVFKPTQMAMKRLFDILVSGVALWLLLPFLAAVAVAIKLTSRGPLFFRQTRSGLHGRPFRMLKFRTMVENAESLKAALAAQNEVDGPVFKITKDPRITSIGRFLRKFSIDELPQLVNVLRGDMSIVGPRPPLPAEVAKYEGWQRRRLSVRPGLTCIWQVSGRNQISFEEWMYMDMQYIDHWSFSKDLSLIAKTFPVVLTGKGAS